MNCFAHALPFLDDAYFAVGSCLPDWLSACDRKCRAREKGAQRFINHSDPVIAKIAQGVVQHHQDDDWFHRTPIFNEMILKFAVELRELFGNERSMRPGLIGHIVVEMLLDAFLHKEHPGELNRFYDQVDSVNPQKVQDAINLFASRPTEQLAAHVGRFSKARFLFDYVTNEGINYRLNRVLERVKMNATPEVFLNWLPTARDRVYENAEGLLAQWKGLPRLAVFKGSN